jgi:hypothetical protein
MSRDKSCRSSRAGPARVAARIVATPVGLDDRAGFLAHFGIGHAYCDLVHVVPDRSMRAFQYPSADGREKETAQVTSR